MLTGFHPLISEWFTGKFGTPTEPQTQGWPEIQAGRDVLIAAPTGSGKTLTAFLSCLDQLVRQGLAGRLEERTEVLYISPLKALSNDIRKNLEEPLAEIQALAKAKGLDLPVIRTAVRTGDTPSAERSRMIRHPPHVMITTPESFFLLITSESGRKLLAPVRTVIVDEIHAVARDKRGAHLALSLERLEALTESRPVRIGLSATQSPIEEIARYLVGTQRILPSGKPQCSIIDAGSRRAMDLAIEVPVQDELSAVASKELWGELYDRVAQHIRDQRTTLVFVNTRRMVERVSHALEERLGPEAIAAHHGSLSREVRLKAEERLRKGEIKAVVATASLELGIDIGHVELVCHLGSPRSFSVALQRIGRAGHWRGATPKGRLFPSTRDELVECCALVRGIRGGRLEQTRIPLWPRDVLSQQIVAEAACREVEEDSLFDLVRRAYPYAQLPRAEFDALITMLSDGISARRGRSAAHLHRDGVNHKVKGRRGARIAALTSGGAIPDNANYAVVAEPENLTVGTVDEDFAIESMAGDIFLLGNTSWRIRRVESGTVRVEDAHGLPPSIPFWNGEAPGRTVELSLDVGELREVLEPLLETPERAIDLLIAQCGIERAGAEQVVRYLAACKVALGALPTQQTLIAERFFDEAGGMQLIVHAPFGMRINRAFGLALRKCFCKTFDFELQAAATDEGVLLSLGPQHSFPLETVWEFLSPNTLPEVLQQAALRAPMFGTRWRWNATRSLALLRSQNGRRVPPPILRMRSDDLLASVFPAQVGCQENVTGPLEAPDHPLINETLRDCLYEAMDLPGLKRVVEQMRGGQLRLLAVDTPEPSPLSHEIVNSHPYSFLDDAPLEERRARAVVTRRSLSPEDARALGALDPAAIAEVSEQVWPSPRDPDEMHDVLLSLIWVPGSSASPEWVEWCALLVERGRARELTRQGKAGWTAIEKLQVAAGAFPELAQSLGPLEGAAVGGGAARMEMIRGWMESSGPLTVQHLASVLSLRGAEVEQALAQLEGEGEVMRGSFSPDASDQEWCERRLLARIHRLTLGRLRKEIEPSSPAEFIRFLLRWQHVQPGTQLHGVRGVAEVIGQLQGFQLAASAWESEVLPARVKGYQKAWLDELCLSGEVVWGRFVPTRPGASDEIEGGLQDVKAPRRHSPSRAIPVTLALRQDLAWLLARRPQRVDAAGRSVSPGEHGHALNRPLPLSAGAQALLDLLVKRGASFWSELIAASRRLPTELEQSLWELVAAGEVSCDGFTGLRALIHKTKHAVARTDPLHSGGRWSLLRAPDDADQSVEPVVRQMLRRYGVVFRDVIGREVGLPPWREMLQFLRRLEARGEVRGGRFVTGFSGEQFALPEAVEAMRAVRRIQKSETERVVVCGADPLNLVGVLTPGARVAAYPQNAVVYRDGAPDEGNLKLAMG